MTPYAAPEPRDEPTIDEVVDDGLLIAIAGVRLAVRNLMILRALRDKADYDEAWYLDATLTELRLLAAEKRSDATRVAEYHRAATERSGRPATPIDYRWEDASTLERREAALLGLAERLEAMGDAEAGAIVDAARASALDDIVGAMRPATTPSVYYAAERDEGIEALTTDLAMLQLRSSGL
jgi:hypothetical protein